MTNTTEEKTKMIATAPTEDSTRMTIHAINNRLNTLMLGMSYLEGDDSNPDNQMIVRSMKLELRDLQDLINQLRCQIR
ncbi:MAG: hypothetical protein AAFV98_13840 [Chloroflexota bacterium]